MKKHLANCFGCFTTALKSLYGNNAPLEETILFLTQITLQQLLCQGDVSTGEFHKSKVSRHNRYRIGTLLLLQL
jgi:hypothetical protein